MAYHWRTEPQGPRGVLVTCLKTGVFGKGRTLPFANWPDAATMPGAALLSFLLEAERATSDPMGVCLPHSEVAALSEDQAQLVGLPPAIPHALLIRSHSTLDEPTFKVEALWLKLGTAPVSIRQQGAIGQEGNKWYRIPLPLLRILDAIDGLANAGTGDRQHRVCYWKPIQEALEAATGASIQPDGYLKDLKIFHAASLSLSVDISKERGLTFFPVLFGRATVRRNVSPGLFDEDPLADPALFDECVDAAPQDVLHDEADQLLPPALQRVFVDKRFDRDEACREAYPLARNTFLVIDPPLRRALDVVKLKQRASEAERRAFVKNPRPALAAALEVNDDAPELVGLFIETQQYADRVTGIGLWAPKVLPWLPTAPNTWLPERIGFRIGDRTVEVAPEALDGVADACSRAMAEGRDAFAHGEVADIPASAETLAAINALRPTAAAMMDAGVVTPGADDGPSADAAEESSRQRYALEHDDNLEEETYHSDLTPRDAAIAPVPPPQFIPPERLFPHQREGFDWLVRCWSVGRPGVLLADDMGLGKTIQTLAFAAWLHAHHRELGHGRGPILVVAPTALLRNWREEHDRHLLNGGIGPITEMYGSGVRAFRNEGEDRRDVVVGHAALSRERLSTASVILTTYETLANYHISLAAVHFPLVIFDEIQKLKTPTTINTHAAKTLNADFVIGLTGTPVENALSELWSIMDRLHPGLLHDLRRFNQRFRPDAPESLRELRDVLVRPAPQGAPVMLRRMKDTADLGKALPKRYFHSLPTDMPAPQAEAYAACIAQARHDKAQGAPRGAMLKVLQRMRGISLHPDEPSVVLGRPEEYDAYIAQSARLMRTIEVLDKVHARGEKALVFIEYRTMQDVVADILRNRFRLSRLPAIINGQTPSSRRQGLVSDFQNRPVGQFDVMVLSPRAAGVGLNITAANHVIHLSRWWNPAVEDQCNDRAYRIGQDKEVSVYCPIARHPDFGDASFDVSLDRLLARKRALSRDLLVPAESEEDYRELYAAAIG